jgi:hypothetical protein
VLATENLIHRLALDPSDLTVVRTCFAASCGEVVFRPLRCERISRQSQRTGSSSHTGEWFWSSNSSCFFCCPFSKIFLSPRITPLLITALVLQPKSGNQTTIYIILTVAVRMAPDVRHMGASVLLTLLHLAMLCRAGTLELRCLPFCQEPQRLSPCACCKGWHAWWPLT